MAIDSVVEPLANAKAARTNTNAKNTVVRNLSIAVLLASVKYKKKILSRVQAPVTTNLSKAQVISNGTITIMKINETAKKKLSP